MWPWLITLLATLLVAGAGTVGFRWLRAHRRHVDYQTSKHARNASAERAWAARALGGQAHAARHASRGHSQDPYAGLPDSHVITTPPMVRVRSQEVPLLDWLHHYGQRDAWSGVVTSVTDRLSRDPLLAPHFARADHNALQMYLMSMLRALTGEGVTVGALRHVEEAHQSLVGTGAEPITETDWNRLASILTTSLRKHKVPKPAVAAIDDMLAPLKAVVLTGPPPTRRPDPANRAAVVVPQLQSASH